MIDTAAKRASCYGLGLLPWRTGVLPTGSDLSASERLHAQGLYSGIAAASPIPTEEPQWIGVTVPGSITDVSYAGSRVDVAFAGNRVDVPTLTITWRNPP